VSSSFGSGYEKTAAENRAEIQELELFLASHHKIDYRVTNSHHLIFSSICIYLLLPDPSFTVSLTAPIGKQSTKFRQHRRNIFANYHHTSRLIQLTAECNVEFPHIEESGFETSRNHKSLCFDPFQQSLHEMKAYSIGKLSEPIKLQYKHGCYTCTLRYCVPTQVISRKYVQKHANVQCAEPAAIYLQFQLPMMMIFGLD